MTHIVDGYGGHIFLAIGAVLSRGLSLAAWTIVLTRWRSTQRRLTLVTTLFGNKLSSSPIPLNYRALNGIALRHEDMRVTRDPGRKPAASRHDVLQANSSLH